MAIGLRTVDNIRRGVSPLLLLLGALAFLLPLIGVSCNATGTSAAVGSAISSIGGNSQQSQQLQQCLAQLSNRDIVTYSGTTLAFGGNPATDTGNLGSCDTGTTTSTPSNGDQGNVGAQPLLIATLVLMVAGIAVALLRVPRRAIVSCALAGASLVLLIVGTGNAKSAILDKVSSSAASGLPPQANVGNLDGFFDIHPALGYWLVFAALVAVIVVNLVAALAPALARVRLVPIQEPPPHDPWVTPPPPPSHPPSPRPPFDH